MSHSDVTGTCTVVRRCFRARVIEYLCITRNSDILAKLQFCFDCTTTRAVQTVYLRPTHHELFHDANTTKSQMKQICYIIVAKLKQTQCHHWAPTACCQARKGDRLFICNVSSIYSNCSMISCRKPEVTRSIVAGLHLELNLQLSAKQLFQCISNKHSPALV